MWHGRGRQFGFANNLGGPYLSFLWIFSRGYRDIGLRVHMYSLTVHEYWLQTGLQNVQYFCNRKSVRKLKHMQSNESKSR